jgi:apolipoprotein D and lipocalin family protein
LPDRRNLNAPARRPIVALAALCALAMATTAPAGARPGAPRPVRPVSSDLYSGRWYEIARTPNTLQKDCQGATSDFQGLAAGAFTVVETCHRGSPTGTAKTIRARAKIVPASDNTRFRMAFFGGLVHQEYWILDHADDNSWAVMATPGGNYVWLLSRRPSLPPSVQAAALARVGALGYAPSRLIFPAQGTG